MQMNWRKEIMVLALLSALSAVLFGFQLGKTGLIDPDEPFYSLTAKEMLVRHDPLTPMMFGHPQFEKPIFFYWVLYACFKWLGISEFSARLGPCLAGLLTVLITYVWGRALFKRRAPALVSAVILAASGQFIIMSRIVLTDIFLCLFVTGALACFTAGYRDLRHRALYWNLVFIFCGLGFLTKGPLGLLIPFSGILAYLFLAGQRSLIRQIPWASGGVFFALISFPWYALMTHQYGFDFLRHFFMHENVRRFFVAEHTGSDKWIFYPLVLLLGFFPWSGFLAPSFVYALGQAGQKRTLSQRTFLFLTASFFPSFFFFVAAKSKLMSYIFPLYPIVALILGAWAYRFYRAARIGFKSSRRLSIGALAGWGAFPVALVIALLVYGRENSIDILAPAAVIFATLVPLSWTALFLFFKRKNGAALVTILAGVVCFSLASFTWLLPAAAPAFSSKGWAEAYKAMAREHASPLLLTSKLFVRGITYYTGDTNVGVFSDEPSGGFYTPHPVRIVSDLEGFSRTAAAEFPIYCLLRKKEVNRLRESLTDRFRMSILESGPQRSWVRLDRV